MVNNTIYTTKAQMLAEEFGLRAWWADEVASGNMTVEEAVASQNARDAEVSRLQESKESKNTCTAEEFLEHLKTAEALR
jgi:hypothetical protein